MRWKLIWPILLTIITPLIVSYFVYPGTHVPPGFGEFPPQKSGDQPGFNLLIFIAVAVACIGVAALLIMPKWFDFKGEQPAPQPNKTTLPWWFYAGIATMLFFWYLMWSHSFAFGNLVYWSFTPLWFGFIVAMDGFVYHRNNGRSILSTYPKLFAISIPMSTLGWVYFEYYDYFVLSNWYYPDAYIAPWSKTLVVFEFLITYTTVTIALLEWYCLLKTFPRLYARYQNGIKLDLNADLLIWAGMFLIALLVVFPYPLFWAVWIGPFAVMTGLLKKYNIWNPFTGLEQGNWGAFVLIALSSMFNGFVWEFWNFGSHNLGIEPLTNPNYWIYDVPYVNIIHIFSEMPLLGYFGYLPFGVLVWQTFIWLGQVFGFNTDITDVTDPQ